MKKNRIAVYSLKYAFAAVLIIFAAVPFLWVVATSFNASKSLLGAHIIPESLTLKNYIDLLSSTTLSYSKWLLNSFKISVISVILIIFVTCTTGYALSRYRFRAKKPVMMIIMILNIFPPILAMIALYTIMQQLGNYVPFLGLNTHGGLICIYVATWTSINTLVVKAYIDTIPVELDESALLEGANSWQVFRLIIFPVIRPIVITVGILAFMSTYGDFVIANLLLKGNDNITAMVGIYQFTQQRFDTDWGIVTAGTIVAAVPVIILFFVTQKYILSGLTTGAIKQ